jgi:ATP-binding protein involved in chromosome partitioning
LEKKATMSLDARAILEALAAVPVAAEKVGGLQLRGAPGAREVVFFISVDPARGPALEPMRQEAERAVARLPGVARVTAVLTAESAKPAPSAPAPAALGPRGRKAALHEHLAPYAHHVVAVASGKGGVGKSTVAANLAVALAQGGSRVGLLDADIYGPSVLRMMGRAGEKPELREGKVVPLEAHGLKFISIAAMVAEDAPMIWRGPMVQTALRQFLEDVLWGELDVLVLDLPPGTGDAQLTIAQKLTLSGAVIVSTPQDIALLDARKGINMFRKTNVPILGVVENMSYYHCPNCGHEAHIFGHGGAEAEAAKLGVPFLGRIPLHADIRLKSDEGLPAVLAGGAEAEAFRAVAAAVAAALEETSRGRTTQPG